MWMRRDINEGYDPYGRYNRSSNWVPNNNGSTDTVESDSEKSLNISLHHLFSRLRLRARERLLDQKSKMCNHLFPPG